MCQPLTKQLTFTNSFIPLNDLPRVTYYLHEESEVQRDEVTFLRSCGRILKQGTVAYMLPEIKVWVDSSTKWKMTEGQEPCLVEFYVPQTSIVPDSKEPQRNLLNECTDWYSFGPNCNHFENMSFHLSFRFFIRRNEWWPSGNSCILRRAEAGTGSGSVLLSYPCLPAVVLVDGQLSENMWGWDRILLLHTESVSPLGAVITPAGEKVELREPILRGAPFTPFISDQNQGEEIVSEG